MVQHFLKKKDQSKINKWQKNKKNLLLKNDDKLEKIKQNLSHYLVQLLQKNPK
jgi:hypothetical protein